MDMPGSRPDSGNPTVRDSRGACGNASYGEGYTGTYRGNAETAKPSPTATRAAFLSRRTPQLDRSLLRQPRVGNPSLPLAD